jgi:hypothetical protein
MRPEKTIRADRKQSSAAWVESLSAERGGGMRFLPLTGAGSHLANWIKRPARPAQASVGAKHRRMIEALASETNRSFAELAPIYGRALADLQASALITDYVPIFASRRVKEFLKRAPA